MLRRHLSLVRSQLVVHPRTILVSIVARPIIGRGTALPFWRSARIREVRLPLQEPRDDRDLTDDRVDPDAEMK